MIVILGVLAATAMPKYMDMRRQSRIAALDAQLGAMRSAQHLATAAFQLGKYEVKNSTGSRGNFQLALIYLADGTQAEVGMGSDDNMSIWKVQKGLIAPVGMAQIFGCQESFYNRGDTTKRPHPCQGFDVTLAVLPYEHFVRWQIDNANCSITYRVFDFTFSYTQDYSQC